MAQRPVAAREALEARRLVSPLDTQRNFLSYFFSIVGFFAGLLVLSLYLLQPWRWSHLILALVMYGLSMTVVDRVLQYHVRGRTLPKLTALATRPRVAILYLTYNDAVEECLEGLANQTFPCDIFVLDDSTKPEVREVVNRYKYVKLRRSRRKDNKAGAINEWLHYYGDKYDYFITYDADSMLPPTAVHDLLLYAEAPENQDVAIFQAGMHIWNAETHLAKLLSQKQNVDNVLFGKMLTHVGGTLWFGHNALCRVKPFREVGIRTDLVSEDFATSCELIKRGHRLLTVPVLTYEGIPNDMKSYLARAMRWFHGGHEAVRLMSRKLPAAVNYRLWTVTYTHLQYMILPLIISIFVFNKPTLLDQFQVSTAVFVAFWLIPALSYALYLQEMKSAGIPGRETLKTIFVATSVRVTTALYEWKALILWAFGRKPRFTVTPKNKLQEFDNRYLVALTLFVALQAAGIAFYNQEALLYGLFWLPPLFASIVILYRVNRAIRRQIQLAEKTGLRRRFEVVPAEKKARMRRLDIAELRQMAPGANVFETPEDTIVISGDSAFPDSVELMKHVNVRGALNIGARSTFHGDLRATGNVEIGEWTVIEGNLYAGGHCKVGRYSTIRGVLQANGDVELNEGCHVELSVTAGGKVTFRGHALVARRVESKGPFEIISETHVYTISSAKDQAPAVQSDIVSTVLQVATTRAYDVQTLVEAGRLQGEARELSFLLQEAHEGGRRILTSILTENRPVTVEKVASLQALAFLTGAAAVKIISSASVEDDAKRLAQFYQMTVLESESPSMNEVEQLLGAP